MNRHFRWLREQLRLWVAQGVVSPAQADRIRDLYPEPKAGVPWGTILFGGLGAVVFGLGIILLFAYNWQAIPKAGKLAVIFLSILAVHEAGQWLSAKPGWQRAVGEALSVLGTMLYGAGIWLVAQIYHIQEHYPNGFLFWGLGALALAWAMPSVAQGVWARGVVGDLELQRYVGLRPRRAPRAVAVARGGGQPRMAVALRAVAGVGAGWIHGHVPGGCWLGDRRMGVAGLGEHRVSVLGSGQMGAPGHELSPQWAGMGYPRLARVFVQSVSADFSCDRGGCAGLGASDRSGPCFHGVGLRMDHVCDGCRCLGAARD